MNFVKFLNFQRGHLAQYLFFILCGVLLLGLMAGCSSTPVYPPANITREQAWASLDWNGEGRGAFRYHDHEDRFALETALNSAQQTWIMAVRIPLLGEEHFSLNYKTGQLEGPLWKRWQQQNPQGDITPLKQALMKVLNLKKVPLKATWDQYQLKFDSDPHVHWTFDWWHSGRFHRVQVEITEVYEYPLILEINWREAPTA